MEHDTIRASAEYANIAKRTLELTPFLRAVRETSTKRYAQLAHIIIKNNTKPEITPSELFAANRKTFNRHSLSHAAIAAMPAGAYADAQIEYEGTLDTLDLEIYDQKHSFAHFLYLGLKRATDIFFGIIGCTLLLPVTIIVKLGNILTGDFAPVFYSTKRIGKNGEEFNFYKFRSMIRTKDGRNAEYLLDELFAQQPELKKQWEKTRKLDNDPRITKMGKILRKTSIDEIPQFINVLKGDMSLIGPRPLMIGELDEHYGSHETYESVKPGLTGWWAANGRSEVEDYNERLQLEYYYANNQSLMLDIKTVLLTIKTLFSKGAK